jgi:diguanylate cyclase (GGDEF)-like protein
LQELNKVIERAKSDGAISALLGLELHGLRDINENLGHAACDQILLLLTRCLREKVTGPALLARVGGGQFAVLLDGKAGDEADQIKEKMEGIVKALQSGKGGKGLQYDFTLNLVTIDKTTEDRHRLLRTLYQPHQATASERLGKNTSNEQVSKSPRPPNRQDDVSQTRRKEQQAAQTMLERSDFHLLFQPIINMYGNQHGLYEAMLCIKTRTGDLIPATGLMRIAERYGLAGRLDHWLAQRAVETLAKLSKHGKQARGNPSNNKPAFFVSFSNAAINDNALLPGIEQQLKAAGLNATQLLFQLDASLLLKQNDPATTFIRQIKKMGAGVVIDKFDDKTAKQGQLTSLEIDFVKINYPVASGTQGEVTGISMVRDAISVAKSLQKKTIINGIENAETLSLLWNYGVDYIQGSYLCPISHEPDYDFDNEHTLDSKQPAPTLWQATG